MEAQTPPQPQAQNTKHQALLRVRASGAQSPAGWEAPWRSRRPAGAGEDPDTPLLVIRPGQRGRRGPPWTATMTCGPSPQLLSDHCSICPPQVGPHPHLTSPRCHSSQQLWGQHLVRPEVGTPIPVLGCQGSRCSRSGPPRASLLWVRLAKRVPMSWVDVLRLCPRRGHWARLGTRGGHLVSGSSTKSLVVALWLGRDRSPALQ